MAAENVQPLESAYTQMREATRPNPPIEDHRGPLVYNITEEGSLNGMDPTYNALPGGGRATKTT